MQQPATAASERADEQRPPANEPRPLADRRPRILTVLFVITCALQAIATGWLGFAEATIFVTVLLAALAYLWRIGALDWSARYQRPPIHRLHQAKAREDRDALVA